MKRTLSFLFGFLGAVSALFGAETKQLQVAVGGIVQEEVPFQIQDIKVSVPSVAKVEIISANERNIRIIGQADGTTEIQLIGGGMSQLYKVRVTKNNDELFRALKRDLDFAPEIEITKNSGNGKFVLKGELSNIRNQEMKNKVVQAYGSTVMDFTTFRPTPEVMLSLQKNLEKVGFKVVPKTANMEPGMLAITQAGEMLTITGSVYSQEDLKKINVVLSSQPWLTVNKGSGDSDGKVQAYVNVQIADVMLQLDIIHVALSKQEARSIGIDFDSIKDGIGSFEGLYSLVKTRGESLAQNGKVGLSTSLTGVLKIFGDNDITRVRRAGFLTFKSNDPQVSRMSNGGKIVVSSDAGVGSTSQLKDYEYGLTLQALGGLTGVDTVSIDLKQELSYPGPISQYVNDAKMEIKKYETRAAYVAKLGEPIAIGGLKEFSRIESNSASLPYLRNIPVFKWLISNEGTDIKEDEVLTIICVRKMIPVGKVDPVAEELKKLAENQPQPEAEPVAEPGAKWYEVWKQDYWKW